MTTEETAVNDPSDLTWGDIVHRVAEEYGVGPLDEVAVHHILWEKTEFPFAFAAHIERQVREFFETTEET